MDLSKPVFHEGSWMVWRDHIWCQRWCRSGIVICCTNGRRKLQGGPCYLSTCCSSSQLCKLCNWNSPVCPLRLRIWVPGYTIGTGIIASDLTSNTNRYVLVSWARASLLPLEANIHPEPMFRLHNAQNNARSCSNSIASSTVSLATVW